jgi:hypothetical protein
VSIYIKFEYRVATLAQTTLQNKVHQGTDRATIYTNGANGHIKAKYFPRTPPLLSSTPTKVPSNVPP